MDDAGFEDLSAILSMLRLRGFENEPTVELVSAARTAVMNELRKAKE